MRASSARQSSACVKRREAIADTLCFCAIALPSTAQHRGVDASLSVDRRAEGAQAAITTGARNGSSAANDAILSTEFVVPIMPSFRRLKTARLALVCSLTIS